MNAALRSMAVALGGDVSGASILCPGPGHSARDRSLSVTLSFAAPDGFLVYSHAGDDWRACRDHVAARLGQPARQYEPPRPARPRMDNGDRAREIWENAKDPRRTLAELYLTAHRGLALTDDLAGSVVRFHSSCPWGSERRPCMLTAFRAIEGEQLVAIHRTALTDDGQKIDRKMLGPVGAAAIKIDAAENVEYGLAIGEGFETCLAGRQLGFRPVWALGSADAIRTFPVLPGVDALTILAETDDSGANAKAIRQCGQRWAAAGREVIVAVPRISGDLNDVVKP